MTAKIDLLAAARALPATWRSRVVGRAAYPDETHDFDEALLALEGQMNLELQGRRIEVGAGEVFIVPAGVPHAVAPGSHGTLVIIDR